VDVRQRVSSVWAFGQKCKQLFAKCRDFAFFALFLKIFVIFHSGILKRVIYENKKGKRSMPPTDGSIKLSKAALWLLKHPNGLEGFKILDMRAVMR
jgi:hypothetical protein